MLTKYFWLSFLYSVQAPFAFRHQIKKNRLLFKPNQMSKNLFLFIFFWFQFASGAQAQLVFTNFEEARLLLGQPNFTSQSTEVNKVNTPGATAVAISVTGKVAVASQSAGRVLIWHTMPLTNSQPADVVIGKTDFTATSYNTPTAASMRNCEGVAFSPDGTKLIVSDGENNRVLIWNAIPTTNNQPADVVIGQANFTSVTAGTSATKLSYPSGVLVTAGGKLIINEYLNNRVLIYNTIPTVNGAAADVVLGQPNFNSNTAGDGANELNAPWYSAVSPEGKLLISDTRNHRILIYNQIPTTNGVSADMVIGQNTLAGTSGRGTAQNKLATPLGLAVSATGQLAIADFGNNRVLLYNTIPTVNGALADAVLGQPNFTSNTEHNGGISAKSLATPVGLHFDFNGRLFVSSRKLQGTSQTGRVQVFGIERPAAADLGISASATMSLPCRDITMRYRVNILNNGPDNATNIFSRVALPTIFTPGGTTTVNVGTYDAASGVWAIPALRTGQTATMVFDGIIASNYVGQFIQPYAVIQSLNQTDLNPANNTAVNPQTVISNYPVPPRANAVTICTGNDTTLTASGAGTIQWFDAATNGNLLFSGNNFNTPVLTATTTYYAELSNGCLVSPRTPVTVTVNQPIANNIISGNQTLCQYQVAGNFTGSTPTGGNGTYRYQWQVSTDGSSWADLPNNAIGTNYNGNIYGRIAQETYFRRRVIAGPCAYNYSNIITVKINPLPAVTINGLPANICVDNAPITITGSPAGGTFSGPGITGNTFDPEAAGTGAHIITFTYTNANNCTNSINRLVLVGPTAYTGNNQSVCIDEPAFMLRNFSPAGGTWSGPGVTANGEFNPAKAGLGDKVLTYTVTGNFNCGTTIQTLSSTKTITVNPLPTLQAGNAQAVCITAADFALSGYSPVGGTWSGTGIISDNVFSPHTAGLGEHTLTYSYRNRNGCLNTAAKTITVTDLPAVTLAPLGSKCSSSFTPIPLTGGSPAGGTYSGPGVSQNSFNPSVAGVGNHTIRYTYTDPAGCVGTATQVLRVDICTGIAEDKILKTLTVFPNPAQTQLTVRFSMPAASSLILKVQSLSGQTVMRQYQAKVVGSYEQTLNIRNLARGIYILQLITDDALIHKRIVIN